MSPLSFSSRAQCRARALRRPRSARGSCARPARGEAGTGPISTIIGVLMLFMTLFFSLQIFLLLHTRSLVNAAAFDGARLVAAGAASPDEAEVRMRSLLGGLQVDVSWAGTTDTTVRVKVTARPSSPILAIPTLGAGVSRTASVRMEGVPWISSA